MPNSIRYPITLYVDKIEFEPEVQFGETTRTVYDLELTEYDMRKLYEGLRARLEQRIVISTRIRVTGRLVS